MNERNENIEGTAETQYNDLGVKTKVILTKKNAKIFFWAGLFHLLQYIDEEGTIHAASKKMGMSYSKCWKLLNRAEEQMGFTFLDRYNGGHGGNSKITEEGREFMKRYEALLDEMQQTGQKIFEKYFEKYF